MKVSLALLADHANVSHDGKLNVLGVFNALNVNQFPAVHPQMHFVITFEAHFNDVGSDHPLEIRCLAPSGQNLFKLDSNMKIAQAQPGHPVRHNQILALNNLQFQEEGGHTFLVKIDGKTSAEIVLDVRLAIGAGQKIAEA